ncbi:lipopolysaccharide biosynthesis protein [Ferruginibacter sp. HRS2-29]|uniref:lipopolysaccharide biosynthesis protein n=1 Tax=Ferruginibacter sp. HRS2-29 TaxID=2487334 RepID=UPI0020CC4162|nr:hypothetical protein [Ferruginibacter sp. HRS2-29]MCP9751440.1 hypothetical protein [Ferruginibacter sp. HRS2-29]
MLAKYLYRNILWRGLLQLSAFLLNILLARHFGAAISGDIFYLASIYSFMVLLLSLSLESGMTYYGVKNEVPAERLVNLSLLMSILSAALLWLLSYFFKVGENGLRPLFDAICISFVCGNLLSTYSNSLFTARKDFVLPNIIAITINCLLILVMPGNGIVAQTLANDSSYYNFYFYSFLVSGIFATIFFCIKYIRILTFRLPSADFLKKIFRYSLTAWIGNLIFFLVYRVDYFFVKKYCMADDLGNYIQVSRIAQLFFLLPTILAAVIFPLTASGNRKNMLRLLAVMSRVILFVYLLACILIGISGQWLFPFIFGDSFTKMHTAFLYLTPGILALSMSYCITAYNAGVNNLRVNLISAFIALLIIAGGNLALLGYYSINIAAAVSSLGYFALLAYVMIHVKKEYDGPLSDFFIGRPTDLATLKKILLNTIRPKSRQ